MNDQSGDDAFRRPAGSSDDGLSRAETATPRPIPPARPPVPAEVSGAFGRPNGVADSFAPHAPQVHPGPVRQPPPPPEVTQAFGRRSAPGTGFEPPAGSRIAPGRDSESPWWSPDAELDPWRDPGSDSYLGGPPILDEPVAPEDDELEPAEVRARRRWRMPVLHKPTVGGLALIVLCCLLLGGAGGAVGYLLTRTVGPSQLHDANATLATVKPNIERKPGSVADIAARLLPSVVSIRVQTSDEVATGSGVVISKDGYILTNNHVVSLAATDSGKVRVVFNDESASSARIVGRDPKTDLAVIKVDKPGLVVAQLGDSSKVLVGDPVIAIGTPFGLARTVTSGIVSALDRPVRLSGEGSDTNAVIDAIQTDAAINPGNSGGALVDGSGAVIGINTAIKSTGSSDGSSQGGSIGVGFAIPMSSARVVAQQLIRTGHVIHPTLGISARSVTDLGVHGGDGAQVEAVDPGGSGDKAGIKEGDVVISVDGVPVDSSEQLTVLVGKRKVGDSIKVTIVRSGKDRTVTAKLQAD
ncbi:MAG TPA: trypsin-like peptidase domain-containing protein [Mycobacteriales bacterium]|nr:trypsin-like peptidase domain-containing protein [Mycobacteriales bacterium]